MNGRKTAQLRVKVKRDSYCGKPCSFGGNGETQHNKTGIVKPLIKPTLELQRCILNTPLPHLLNARLRQRRRAGRRRAGRRRNDELLSWGRRVGQGVLFGCLQLRGAPTDRGSLTGYKCFMATKSYLKNARPYRLAAVKYNF